MIASLRQDDAAAREIARGLATAVQAAVEVPRPVHADTRSLTWAAAVDVAQLLDLRGLAALLLACEPHGDSPPVAVTHALDRLRRLARETLVRDDLAVFTQVDRELEALAGTLSAQEWSQPGSFEPTPEPLQSVTELLGDFDVDDPETIANAKVTLPVAAGLRAALDWIGADMGGGLRVSVHDAALTLSARVAHDPGLGPAGAVLSLGGGALLPEPDGRWSLRVPLHAERPAFLLGRQGELSLALPWHAVARLRIADDNARTAMTEPSLPPWSPLERTHGERPAALLALGLTRAWLHLDHIVWRVFTQPEPAAAGDAVPGGRHVVRTEEGGEFWVVEVGEALIGVPQLETPRPQPRRRQALWAVSSSPPEPTPTLDPPTVKMSPTHNPARLTQALVEAAPEPMPAAAPPSAAAPLEEPLGSEDVEEPAGLAPTPGVPPTLGPADVRPVGRAVSAAELARALEAWHAESPLGPPRDAEPALRAPVAPERASVGSRFALVVDDSLVARLSLGRVLEREGWMVEWVERAGEMWDALQGSEWGVVFVDVSLPDASGRDHLRALLARQAAAKPRFEVVALTRDANDERLARDSGLTRILRKPFTRDALEVLVHELPSPRTDA